MSNEYRISTVVPDEYRANRLPKRVREWVETQSIELSEAYEIGRGDGPIDYDKERAKQLEGKEWRWWGYGSERTVACLGSTHGGRPIYGTYERVVIKFNPSYRPLDALAISRSERTVESITANLHELAVWKWACDHGDGDKFATILDYGEYGDWIAQRYALPVYPNSRRPSHCQYGNHDYLTGWPLVSRYKTEMQELGYNPHLKDGNVGVIPENDTTVCIDFGDHFGIEELEVGELLAYVVGK